MDAAVVKAIFLLSIRSKVFILKILFLINAIAASP